MQTRSCNKGIYSTVDIKLKVIAKDIKQLIMHNNQIKYKTDCVEAKATSITKLVLWHDAMAQADVRKSYHFQLLKISILSNASSIISHKSYANNMSVTS